MEQLTDDNIRQKINSAFDRIQAEPDSIGSSMNIIADSLKSYADFKNDKDALFVSRIIKGNASGFLLSKSIFFAEMAHAKIPEFVLDDIEPIKNKTKQLVDLTLHHQKDFANMYNLIRDTTFEIEKLIARKIEKA